MMKIAKILSALFSYKYSVPIKATNDNSVKNYVIFCFCATLPIAIDIKQV